MDQGVDEGGKDFASRAVCLLSLSPRPGVQVFSAVPPTFGEVLPDLIDNARAVHNGSGPSRGGFNPFKDRYCDLSARMGPLPLDDGFMFGLCKSELAIDPRFRMYSCDDTSTYRDLSASPLAKYL
jgi:hypothetical protein